MKKETEGMPPLEHTPTAPKAHPHPAEVEAANLRKALAEERIKTEALSRRCIRLGDALEAAIRAEDNRKEQDMFALINGNCYHRKALAADSKRRWEREKKANAAYRKACRRNATCLSGSAAIAFMAIILGFVGFINAALAAITAGVALAAFGWALNDCVYLLGRCE